MSTGDQEYKALAQEGFTGTLDDMRRKFFTLGAANRLYNAIGAAKKAVYVGTWAGRPTTSLTVGDEMIITDLGPKRTNWYWNGTRWDPEGTISVYENKSIITGTLTAADQLLLSIPFPAGLLTGRSVDMYISYGRDGSTDALGTTSYRFGLTGTLADSQYTTWNQSSGWGGGRSLGVMTTFDFPNNTTVVKVGTANGGPGWIGSSSGALLNTTQSIANLDTNQVFFTLSTTMMGTPANRPQIGYTRIDIR